MNIEFKRVVFYSTVLAISLSLGACSGKNKQSSSDSVDDTATVVQEIVPDTMPKPGEPNYKFPDHQALLKYLDTCKNSAKYKSGIIPVIANQVPEYAEKLIANKYKNFIIVDKASMRVLLYDKFGNMEKEYGMACARNFGTKYKKADSRTPEGFFEIEGKYDSTDWLFTDDNGVTHPGKGAFGPRFLRIRTPVSMQIGIHGTSSRGSIGRRVSHGCIRIQNENIMELFGLVEPGTPVIVLPGKRDREVNRNEGVVVPFFPTAPEYAMKDAEYTAPVRDRAEVLAEQKRKEEQRQAEAAKAAESSSSESEATESDSETIEAPAAPAAPAESAPAAPTAPVETPAAPRRVTATAR